ncbi:MAG TPA: YceI family protein [Saprospiraceae bacterium]|nr:YceI family protein [Saprospiraceae bacterium]
MEHRIIRQGIRRSFLATAFCLSGIASLFGQKYYSKVGQVVFTSDAPLEKIEGRNSNGLIVLDAANGRIECSVLIKGFQFEKALMQDHFNENYMESHKFPKGVFKGTITNMQDIHLKKDGTYTAVIKGDLTLHGITKPFSPTGKVVVKGGKITASSTFEILVADFNIEIPKVVRENIAEKVKVTIQADLLVMEP